LSGLGLPPRPPGSWGDAWERVEPLLARMDGVLEERVLPLEGRFFAGGFEAVEEDLEAVRDTVRAEGLWGPQVPESLGGLELPFLEHAYVSELLGASPLGHFAFGCPAPDAGNLEILEQFGTAEQKREFLEPLARGETRSCFAMTEPDRAGSNPVWMDTRARLEGDEWVVTGRKWFTSAADGADFAVVMAVTDPEAPKHRRASLILVPLDTPGYRLVRNLPVMGEAGGGWASHGEVVFEDCRVPASNLLGERGGGFAIAQARLGPGRIHHAMRWLGICRRAFDLMCRRAVSRELAPGETLADLGTIQSWVAESAAEIHAARLVVLDAAHRIDAEGSLAARDAISLLKFQVAETLQRVLDRALQVHGALGMTDDTPIAWFYRHERAARIYDGPDEVHKASAGRRLLKRYRS
jgi:acyl-CoA dehydrogenase